MSGLLTQSNAIFHIKEYYWQIFYPLKQKDVASCDESNWRKTEISIRVVKNVSTMRLWESYW
jgi:hypothetical protein